MTKKIFIAATMQNDGKTTVSLGLMAALKKIFKRVGFIKPIGQRYLVEQGYKVDDDSVLIDGIFGIKKNIKDMSPVAIEKGFTERYIQNGPGEDYIGRIKRSFNKVAEESDLVVIEGTGHAGVGSVFDLSNATVARQLGANVVLISSGGVGRPIDEVMLNKALFDKERVKLAGVAVNKVLPEKYDKISKVVRLGLEKKGLRVLGVMPYQKILDTPTVREIKEELNLPLLSGESNLDFLIQQTLVCAMVVKDAVRFIRDGALIITGGDREDIIQAAIKLHLDRKNRKRISGIILSGGIIPGKRRIDMMKRAKIPILMSEEDTYAIASKVYSVKVKIKPQDHAKIRIIMEMVEKYIDIDSVVALLK